MSTNHESNQLEKQDFTFSLAKQALILAVFFLALWASCFCGVSRSNATYPYFYLWIPFPLAYLLSIKRNKIRKGFSNQNYSRSHLCVLYAIVIPNLVVCISPHWPAPDNGLPAIKLCPEAIEYILSARYSIIQYDTLPIWSAYWA